MNLSEMHVAFRQYSQQMGIQNVRAILPEQIDLLLNTAISDTVNTIIKENIGITNDRVITDNSKIGQVNALRTLYKVKEIQVSSMVTDEYDGDFNSVGAGSFCIQKQTAKQGKLSYNAKLAQDINSIEGFESEMPDALFLVDFALSYKVATKGLGVVQPSTRIPIWAHFEEDADETNYFPVRLIDDAFLADTLNDFILKPSLRSPIIVTYNKNSFDLYIEKFNHSVTTENGKLVDRYLLINNLLPWKLRVSYIDKPNKVKYLEDVNGTNIECDLPEYMHYDIVKRAVDLYRVAVSGSLYAAQQQERAGQQENMRNNYRNESTQRQ